MQCTHLQKQEDGLCRLVTALGRVRKIVRWTSDTVERAEQDDLQKVIHHEESQKMWKGKLNGVTDGDVPSPFLEIASDRIDHLYSDASGPV